MAKASARGKNNPEDVSHLLVNETEINMSDTKKEVSYHMPIRKSYGVRGGGPNQSGINEQRLKEIFEDMNTGEEETESLWYFIAQRYYGTDRVLNNKIIKLMSFFSQNRELFLAGDKGKSKGPDCSKPDCTAQCGSDFAVQVCTGIIRTWMIHKAFQIKL